MQESNKRTEIADLGEFGLIKHLTENIKLKHSSSVKGIGDDCAIIDYSGMKTLISTDMLVEGIHFDLMYCPLKHLGYKAAVVNFSDVIAMNAMPKQITVSIAVSNRFSVEAMDELYDGIRLACENYQVDLIGGDTTSSPSGLVISITVLGDADEDKICYRSGAKEHDLICVTGDLGAAYMGLQVLEREKVVFKANPDQQPDLVPYHFLIEKQLKPEARADVVKLLFDSEILPTSMIDVSDGLASEIIHICTASKVGCSLYDEKIPINPLTYETAVEFKMDPSVCALNGGEDYELLFTVSQKDFEKVKDIREIAIIGHITDASLGINLIDRIGAQHNLTAQGWDALLKKQNAQ
ncbi:MAG: thiamine-phosphate kinase [Bacteroidota bacterium]